MYNARLVQICQRQNYQQSVIDVYVYAGYLNRIKGSDFEGISQLYKALVIAERKKLYPKIAYIYYSLGHSYYNLNQYTQSMNFCKKGLALLKKYHDPITEMEILNIYGANYRRKKDYPLTLEQYQRFYKIAQQVKETWYEAEGLHEIGWTYQAMHQFKKAYDHYQQALKLARSTGSFDLEASILLNLAGLLMAEEKWLQAQQYCLHLQKRSSRIKNTSVLLDAHNKLYIIYKKLGRHRESLRTYEQYNVLKDSLNRETNEKRIEALQAQYENSQKESQLKQQQVLLLSQQNKNQELSQARNMLFAGLLGILLISGLLFWNNRRLKGKNQQIIQQAILLENARKQLSDWNQSLESRVEERTKELSEANDELIRKNHEIKEALFQGQAIERKRVAIELHDNLSSLLSALNMSIQGIDPRGLTSKEQVIYQNIRQMMGNAYAEVRNISHNILPIELMQGGLNKAMESLITRLNENTKIHFHLRTNLLNDRLPAEIEFNIYSITLELINNIIKHANASNAIIQLEQRQEEIDLIVVDNGHGINNNTFHKGIGMQNIQSRLDALGGAMKIGTTLMGGTSITITIPFEAIVASIRNSNSI
ncbi:hypothetical protein GCM10028807_47040 [Spirosoma daeguense]